MKKTIEKIKNYFIKKDVSFDDSTIEYAIITALNKIIQSPQLQDMTFKVSSSCDKTSIINDIEFCNEVYVHDKYTWSDIDDICVGACKAVKDTCRSACDVGCLGISSCTKPCKSGCDSAYNGCVDLCSYTTLSGGYEFRLMNVKGVGGIQVTNVYDVIPKPDEQNVFSVSMDLNVPKVTSQAYYKIWQDPIPAISGTIPVVATDVKGSATGTLTIKCNFENPDNSGYYLQIDSIDIDIPKNVFDSNLLLSVVSIFGMDISYLTGGIVDLNQMLLDLANGELSDVVEGVLNDLLNDYKLMDFDCPTPQN